MSVRDEVRHSLTLLDEPDRRRYRVALIAQVLLAGMDLVGVLLIGAVGLLAAAAGTGQPIPGTIAGLLEALGMGQLPPAQVAVIFGAVAAVILATKSVLSLLIQRRVSLFLARRVVSVGRRLINGFLSQSLLDVQRRPANWASYAFVEGLTSGVSGVLNQYLVIVGDIAVLVVLGAALLVFDPVTTLVTVVYFLIVVWAMSTWLGRWSRQVSGVYADSSIGAREAIHDSIATFRESSVAGRRDHFRQEYLQQRWVYAKGAADNTIIAAIPRFGMEVALVLGAAVLVIALLLSGSSLTDAVGGLALFLAAVARVMPSLLRLNAGIIGVHAAAAAAERTMQLFGEVRDVPVRISPVVVPPQQPWGPFDVRIEHVSLWYPDRDVAALHEVSLTVPAGGSLALVGATGSGKSSLVDVLLGVVPATSGSVLIDGRPAAQVIEQCPGSLAYVPQSVAIVHGSIAHNVALGLPTIEADRVWEALRRAHLAEFVEALPDGVETLVGERGVRLSGGQRQRLGLARALYSIPSVLVLDEATSSLDAETERAIADTISSLGSQVTTITVAHRLATIRTADQVAYLSHGRVESLGTFDQVRAEVPRFERQARLLGL